MMAFSIVSSIVPILRTSHQKLGAGIHASGVAPAYGARSWFSSLLGGGWCDVRRPGDGPLGSRVALAAAHIPLDPCGLLADADTSANGRGRCHPCKPSTPQASASSRWQEHSLF